MVRSCPLLKRLKPVRRDFFVGHEAPAVVPTTVGDREPVFRHHFPLVGERSNIGRPKAVTDIDQKDLTCAQFDYRRRLRRSIGPIPLEVLKRAIVVVILLALPVASKSTTKDAWLAGRRESYENEHD